MRLDKRLSQMYPDISRSQLSDYIKRGFITVDGNIVNKPAFSVDETHNIILNKSDIFVSRGAEKLEHAIHAFQINLKGKLVVDVGASTGGFTQSVLNHGAAHVYAYDVGKDQMVLELKSDARVSSFEQTNILDVMLPKNDLCVVDVSFTSVIPILKHLSSQTSEIIFLLKPQFETSAKYLKKGILKSEKEVARIIKDTLNELKALGFIVKGFSPSPIKGKSGNQEYLIYCQKETL